MKKVFNIDLVPKNVDAILLFVRIGIAALMLVHGVPKLVKLLSEEPIQFASVFGMSPVLSLGLAVFAEFFCSLLILLGLGTRLATVPLIITMLIAVFYIHAEDPFARQELGLHYLLVYILLLVTGSGRYSVDHLLHRKLLQPAYSKG